MPRDVFVSNSSELAAALADARAGDEIQLAPGSYGDLSLDGLSFPGTVLITSQYPGTPAQFDSVLISDSSNIAMDSLHIDNPFNGVSGSSVVRIEDSQGISISNSEINGRVDDDYTGHYGIYVVRGSDIQIMNNSVHDVKDGVTIMDSNNVDVVRTQFDYLGNDAIKVGGTDTILLDGNVGPNEWHMEAEAHADFIQFQISPSGAASRNVVITNNVAIHGNVTRGGIHEGEFQGIFASADVHNVLVENNLIVNDMVRGISIGDSDTVIRNNTVLNMSQPKTSSPYAEARASLIFSEDRGAVIEDNIVASTFATGFDTDNNLTLQYTDASDPYFYDSVFANAVPGRNLSYEDLQIVGEGATNGAGARFDEDWSGGASAPAPAVPVGVTFDEEPANEPADDPAADPVEAPVVRAAADPVEVSPTVVAFNIPDSQDVSDSAVFVSSAEELEAAYAALSASGGGRIYISPDADLNMAINLEDGGNGPVVITSANPNAPAMIQEINIDNISNLTITGVTVNSQGANEGAREYDLTVSNSSNIEISNVAFQSDADGFYDPTSGASEQGASLGLLRDSENLTFSNNTVAGYFNGLASLEVSGLEITGNEFSHMQADGVRMGGVENVEISGNHFHSWFGSTNSANHDDMIQMWSVNADIHSNNVVITDNILDTTDGGAVQGIFIGNELNHDYHNFTISDNLLYSGLRNGITLAHARDSEITNNTVLWNENAATFLTSASGTAINHTPVIWVDEGDNITLSDNISSGYLLSGDINNTNNITINYNDPSSPYYVDAHFVGATGGDVGLEGLARLADSSLLSVGSSHGVPGAELPAPVSPVVEVPVIETPVAEVPVVEVPVVEVPVIETPAIDTPVTVDPAAGVFVALDFENGLFDSSDNDAILTGGAHNIEDGFDGNGFQIGGRDHFTIARGNENIHELSSFAFEMDIQLNGDEATGRFVNFYKVFEARLQDDGTLQFTLTTDEGEFVVQSDGPTLTNGLTHTLSVGYDDDHGQLSLAIDGEVIDTIEASGVTAPVSFFGLTIGDDWTTTVDAMVDNVYFGDNPKAVGFDFGADYEDADQDISPVEDDVEVDQDVSEPAPVVPQDLEPIDPALSTFAFLFDDGLDESMDRDVDTRFGNEANLVDSEDGQGLLVDGRLSKMTIGRNVDEIHSMEGFGFSLDVDMLDADDAGRFARFYKVFEARLEEDHTVSFTLTTDEGEFTVNSQDEVFEDGASHNLAFGYDNAAGKLAMMVDGVLVDYTDASGTTADQSYFGITLGDDFQDGPRAILDNVMFTETADDVGIPIDEDLAIQSLFNQPHTGGLATNDGVALDDVDEERTLELL